MNIYNKLGTFFFAITCGMLLCAYSVQAADKKEAKGLINIKPRKGCPCYKCIKVARKQHPYTKQEKLMASVSLQLASVLNRDVLQLMLEYVLDEHDAWITLEGPIVGRLEMPQRQDGAVDRCDRIVRYMDIMEDVPLLERLMDEDAQFKSDDIKALAQFFDKPQQDPCTLYSLCKSYKISAKKRDGYVCVDSRYHLDTFARLPGCIEHIKEAQKKGSTCCTVL